MNRTGSASALTATLNLDHPEKTAGAFGLLALMIPINVNYARRALGY